jgi:AcrR family transcriptional regulator
MARVVASKGYGDATLADIVAAANVSRRTFYEHFADKAECLLALYEHSSNRLVGRVRTAIDPQADGPQQVRQAMAAYLDTLAQHPELLRTVFMDILALGERGLAVRRQGYERLADLVVDMSRHRAAHTGGQALPRPLAMAVVGGVNELVLMHIEQGRAEHLRELLDPACALLMAVAQPMPHPSGDPRPRETD